MNVVSLLRLVNQQHGMEFVPVGPLEGYQGGVHALIEPETSRRAVLKMAPGARAQSIAATLRNAGYPTPRVLFAGVTAEGTHYHVQEFVPGTPLEFLTESLLEEILAINELQANMSVDTEQNWSSYVHSVVFANESGWADHLRQHSADTAQLLSVLETATRRCRNAELPTTDIVHGDFDYDNILVRDGKVTGVVDLAAAGCGTRAIDLATLLHSAYVYDSASGVLLGRLHNRLLEIAGPEGRLICLAYRIMAMLDWSIHHHPPASVAHYVHCGWQILQDLGHTSGST